MQPEGPWFNSLLNSGQTQLSSRYVLGTDIIYELSKKCVSYYSVMCMLTFPVIKTLWIGFNSLKQSLQHPNPAFKKNWATESLPVPGLLL